MEFIHLTLKRTKTATKYDMIPFDDVYRKGIKSDGYDGFHTL